MSNQVTLTIDDIEVKANEGDRLLWVALENDIYIPNLCALKDRSHPHASCRLCFVEVEGRDRPVTSCTLPVTEGMVVKTRSPAVDRLLAAAFELLLSDHNLNCKECPANRACELQKIAKERKLKLKLTKLKPLEREVPFDDSPETYYFDRSRCVLCARCVFVDQEVVDVGALGYSRRGLNRMVSTFQDIPLSESPCIECGQCVEACPVGALNFRKKDENQND